MDVFVCRSDPVHVYKLPGARVGKEGARLLLERAKLLAGVTGYDEYFARYDIYEEESAQLVYSWWNRRDYNGWLLKQVRVQPLPKSPVLHTLDWKRDLRDLHYHLWKFGIALVSPNELFGFLNKGRAMDGDTVLSFDLGSIRSDKEQIMGSLTGHRYDTKIRKVCEGLLGTNDVDTVAEYERFLRRYINREALEAHWCSRVGMAAERMG